MPPTSPHPILTQHFDSNQVAFAKIDGEIAAFQESIRVLNAFRNTFTTIYRLPPEVLTRIFSFVRHFPRSDIYHGNAPFSSWLAVTHVSQNWRNVGLGSPSLWSYISSAFRKQVGEECLRRSKAAPLTVDFHNVSSSDVDQVVGPSLFRIRELTLGLSSNTWNSLSPNLSSPAPRLEYLSISITNIIAQSQSPSIPETLFAGTTPHLRRLELFGCSIDINSSLFTDLTALELRNPPQKLSATDLLTVLHKLPRLTSLSLSSILHSGAAPITRDVDIATFPSLAVLSISGRSFVQDLDILSHLSFPATTTLRFSSGIETWNGKAITPLADFLSVQNAARLQDWSTVLPNEIDLQCVWGMVTLLISTADVTQILVFELHGPKEETLEISDNAEVATLFSSSPMASITSFTTDCNISIGSWSNTFGHLTELNLISAIGIFAGNLLSTIVKDFKDTCPASFGNKTRNKASSRGRKKKGKGSRGGGRQKAGSSSQAMETWDPIFPKLASLDLQNMLFPTPATDLIAALRARKMANKGIEELEITECQNVDGGVVEKLRDSVGHVDWDEWMGTESDDDGEGEGEDEGEDEDSEDHDDDYDDDDLDDLDDATLNLVVAALAMTANAMLS
ncbi:hypothetical protein BDN72DRAFT_847615 [Pluteus cervinus]|uniref:Uncharacterized protein n=1 Tax=Pluteus cervinus TaxID=181527 RepID=A0ACD3ADH4_9AGAR|nr:hypothetical protein BDN72DRAFT_847615 [Pluteus cervinus]